MDDYDRKVCNEFKTLLKKIKKKASEDVYVGAVAEGKYTISCTLSGKFVCTFDKKKTSKDEFLVNFNPNPDKITDSDFLKILKSDKTAFSNLDVNRGRFITSDVDDFVYGLYKSQLFHKYWKWSDKIDKRMGGKKGIAGRKYNYSGLKTKAVKMPILLIDDLKKIAEFLAANQGGYDLSNLNKLLIKKQKRR